MGHAAAGAVSTPVQHHEFPQQQGLVHVQQPGRRVPRRPPSNKHAAVQLHELSAATDWFAAHCAQHGPV